MDGKSNQAIGLLFSSRVMAVMFFSFSSTLPLVLISGTLQAWYTEADASLPVIGSLSLLQYAYLIKFFWAPLVDRFSIFRMGVLRGWVLLMQFIIVIGLIVMSWLSPKTSPWLLFAVAATIAFFSATQDVAIDGYRVRVLLTEERGFGAAVTSVAGRMAMLVAGGLALIIAAKWGWHLAYLIQAQLMLLLIAVTFISPSVNATQPQSGWKDTVIRPFQELLTRKYIVPILILVVIYKFADALALSLNTAFLLRGVHFTLMEIGVSYKFTSVLASLLGGVVGGYFLPTMGLYRGLIWFGFSQTASNLLFMLLALVGKNFAVMLAAIFADYFCGGLSTIAFVALLLALCSKKYSATQYAILSAMMAISRVVIGPAAALLVKALGWADFYLLTFFCGFPALFLLRWLRNKVDFGSVTLQSNQPGLRSKLLNSSQ